MTFSDDSEATRGKSSTGKLVVVTMIAVALIAATFAWWWNFNRGRRALEFYGPTAATLIRTAPKVELLTDTGEIDISKAPGLLNARASLLSDASYLWHESVELGVQPDSAIRFSDGEHFVVIEFDYAAQSASTSSTARFAKLMKKTADGWRHFIERNIVKAGAQPDSTSATPPGPKRTVPSE